MQPIGVMLNTRKRDRLRAFAVARSRRVCVLARSGRVEEWRGGLGVALRVAGPFVCRCPSSPPCSVSTPRSSNRTCGFPASGSRTRCSCVRTRALTRTAYEFAQPAGAVQVWVRAA
jgi:hypothetical protein